MSHFSRSVYRLLLPLRRNATPLNLHSPFLALTLFVSSDRIDATLELEAIVTQGGAESRWVGIVLLLVSEETGISFSN